MKRIISMLMALAMALSLFPAIHAHANDESQQNTQQSEKEAVEAFFDNPRDAFAFLRSMMLQHVPHITVKLPISEYSSDILRSIYAHAVSPSVDPKEGDTLLYQSVLVEIYADIKAGYAYLHYSFTYLTTPEEDAVLDEALDVLVAEFGCDPRNAYSAFQKIYNWVCANVTYVGNTDDPYDYTAYGALFNRRASSQGFALLIYQLACKMGLNCRVITGTLDGKFHAWNTVRVEPRDYNVDAALDAGKSAHTWFLKGDSNMTGHSRDSDPIALYLPTCPRDYLDTPELCQQIGHRLEAGNCTTGLLCRVCGFQDEPQQHAFPGEFATKCQTCGYVRHVTCESMPYRLMILGVSEDDPPQLELYPGITVTQVDAYAQSESVYCWVHELVFPQKGNYTVTARFQNRKEAVYEVQVFEHTFYVDKGVCMICGYEDENFHPHEWRRATCHESRTCTICGLAEGEPLGHFFASEDCSKVPGVCVTCGFTQQEPAGHVYSSNNSYQCVACGRIRSIGCENKPIEYWFSVLQSEGYQLIEADPGLAVTQGEHDIRDEYHWWQYLFTAEPGQYDVTFLNLGTGKVEGVTLLFHPHGYVDGQCPYCGEKDPGVHFHDWVDATCHEPQTCATCGLTEGEPREHQFENTPCTQDRGCIYCDLVIEAPSHLYWEDGNTNCSVCGQERVTVCQGMGLNILVSSSSEGDFYLAQSLDGVSLVLTEYFVSHGIHYWEYTVYCAYAGLHEVILKQKGSKETMEITLQVQPHDYVQGICRFCLTPEEIGHVHSWRSATCTKSATCAECGQTQGEPLNHDYGNYRCTEYAVCGRCYQNRGPVKHTYDDRYDQFCNVCNQQHVAICFGKELTLYLENYREEGFWLENKPPQVSAELMHTFMYGLDMGYQHKYLLKFLGTGSFELKFVDADYKEHVYLTVDVYAHEYENGVCAVCDKVDLEQHVHDWIPATCYDPSKCAECFITEGDPLGHSFEKGVCVRCGREVAVLPGDVDADGEVTYLDAMAALQAGVGLVTLSPEAEALADVDGDKEVTYLDAMSILQYAVGLITQWGNGA